MPTQRLHLWIPLLTVACSSQLSDLETSREARQERESIRVESTNVSAATDSRTPTTDCSDECSGGALPELPRRERRAPETRTNVLVGAKQTVTLSIEIAPPPPTANVDCSPLTLTMVGKRTAAVGESLSLQAYAGELDGAELGYEWRGPEQLEVIADDSATFHCEQPGDYELLLRLVSPQACSTELPFTLSCLEAH